MKTIFVVNPKAGQGINVESLIERIHTAASKINASVEVYVTEAIGDAENFVKNYCTKFGAAKFIACGGDGTLSEVLNGAIYVEGAQIGVFPIGTGNDFCRNFDRENAFEDITSIINGECVKCDAIKYHTVLDSEEKTGYCINMFNIGFDCNVAYMASEIKRKPFVSGSFAYFMSILINLIKKKGANLKIEVDGNVLHNGPLLLTSIANGSYCGGGVMSNPLASVQDGLININIIKNVSRLKFIKLLPYYMKGTYLNLKNIENIITSLDCNNIIITPFDDSIKLCVDGEVLDAGKTEIKVMPNAFDFIIPSKKNFSRIKNITYVQKS